MNTNPKMKIMIIDDSITNLNITRTALEQQYEVLPFLSAKKALKLFERMTPDLILLDVDMPEMNGFEVIRHIKQSPYPVQDVPVIFLTAMNDSEYDGLNLGAVDYIIKPFSYPLLLKRIELHLQLQLYRRHLERMMDEKTEEISELQYAIVRVMSEMVERRDGSAGQHLLRTQDYLKILLAEVKKSNIYTEELQEINEDLFISASQLHDVGKISIPDRILLKPGKLTREEFEVMKTHTSLGKDAINGAMAGVRDINFLEIAAAFAGSHHERWDGIGYPDGLRGKDIPIEGRLMAIVDVYDALISERPYKRALPHEDAARIIVEESGTHFDPLLVEVFASVSDRFKAVTKKYTEGEAALSQKGMFKYEQQ